MSKVALVTGSATGLGKQIALQLAQEKYQIVVNYRTSEDEAQELVTRMANDYGAKAIAIKADVALHDEAKFLIDATVAHFGNVHILVNTAGPYIFKEKKMLDYTVDEWESMVNGNLNSVFYLAKYALPHMRLNNWGRIINFGFNSAESAPAWMYRSAYAAAKVGLVSLTKTLAQEEALHGISVNMICPGDITHPWKERTIADSLQQKDSRLPFGREGTGEDVARVISFLCAEQSDFVTGGIIPVTGSLPSIKM